MPTNFCLDMFLSSAPSLPCIFCRSFVGPAFKFATKVGAWDAQSLDVVESKSGEWGRIPQGKSQHPPVHSSLSHHLLHI